MGSTGARYILLPVYVVNIGLLFAFLLTSGLVLAWVTIYRHEECIKELKQMLNEKQTGKQNFLSTAIVSRSNMGKLDSDSISDKEQQQAPFERDDSTSQRLRRQLKGFEQDSKYAGTKRKNKRRGKKGKPGPPGPQGPRGDRGGRGERGERGDRGDRGDRGESGATGEKGDRGREGQVRSQSAHIVGLGRMETSKPTPYVIHTVISWKESYSSENMDYKNGYLRVGVRGYYFIYSQMYYYDGNSSYTGHGMYIDDRQVLKAVYSVFDNRRKFHTQFTSGIFFIGSDQKISVGTSISRNYMLNELSSFFGAFLLHQ